MFAKQHTETVENPLEIIELDEMYWFVLKKPKKGAQENVYVMTAVSRNPRMIVSFDTAFDKSPERIQGVVDSSPAAKTYYTDGFQGYIDLVCSDILMLYAPAVTSAIYG